MTLSRDGRRLYVGVKDSRCGEPETSLRILDAQSGDELARRSPSSSPTPFVDPIALDEARNRLYASESLVLDASSLAERVVHNGLPHLVVDGTQAIAINVSTPRISRLGSCFELTVQAWTAGTQPDSSLATNIDACPSLAMAMPPDAPAGFSSRVSGRRVMLSWAASPRANDYEVEAGWALTRLTLARVRTGGATQYAVDNVPPGTYYVRVRAINDVDASAASSEVIVIVP